MNASVENFRVKLLKREKIAEMQRLNVIGQENNNTVDNNLEKKTSDSGGKVFIKPARQVKRLKI
jgi:hypothetical protein